MIYDQRNIKYTIRSTVRAIDIIFELVRDTANLPVTVEVFILNYFVTVRVGVFAFEVHGAHSNLYELQAIG